jgi:glycosyltransferase involved in cell wall biosynthesis
MRILFLVPYPIQEAPSQRFRFEQYLSTLKEAGYDCTIQSFLTKKAWLKFYKAGNFVPKALGLFLGYMRRAQMLLTLHKFDFVFVHRELSPAGPPLLSWLISKVWKKKIIYDFDDAIWLTNYSENNKLFARLKSYENSKTLMKRSWKNSCGNHWLVDQAKAFNPSSFYIPTTIDTVKAHNRVREINLKSPVIGWTGSHSTISYLESILPQLRELVAKHPFELVVISNLAPEFTFPSMRFIKWNAATEIDDLLQIDIGLMPLPESRWAEGKCGLKALQYMALGIVPAVSPIGVNSSIVTHQVNGIHVLDGQWEKALSDLLCSPEKTLDMGRKTRDLIIEDYSVLANEAKFLHLFAQIH